MNKKTLQERQRRKQQQIRRRAMIRLGLYAAGFVLLLVFLVRGIILPIFRMFGGRAEIEVAEVIETTSDDPSGAIRIPIKGSGDESKLMAMTPGWHGEEGARWYQNPDGTYFANGFQAIDGQQYYFTADGFLAKGWVTNGAKEYYFDENGTYIEDMTHPCIALTFDDGPGDYTEELLNCLEENGAHATFFMVGQNVGLYPEAVQHMVRAGCEIGNHSWNHAQLSTLSAEQIANEFDSTDMALIEACGQPSTVIRPPYGDYNTDVLSIGGKPFILWCLDSLDWSYKDAELDYQEIMNKGNLYDGTIILMHDIHQPSVECAKRIIPELIEKGYRLLTVSKLAEVKGVKMQNAVYTDFWKSSLEGGLVPGYESEETVEVGFTPTYGQVQTANASSLASSSVSLYNASKKKDSEEEVTDEESEEEETDEESEEEETDEETDEEEEEYSEEYSEEEESYEEDEYEEEYDDEYYDEDYYDAY